MKYILSFLLYVAGITLSFCQTDTTVFYSLTGEVSEQENAVIYIELRRKNKRIILTEYAKDQHGTWKQKERKVIVKRSDTLFTYKADMYAANDYSPKEAHVKMVTDSTFYIEEYNHDDELINEGHYELLFPKIRHGLMIDYYNNGKKRGESMYRNNQVVWSEKWLLNGEKGINNVYSVVDEEPTINNKDINEFKKSIIYELNNRFDNRDLNGIVIIEFVIMEDGSIKEIQILQSSSPQIADEVIDVILATDGHWNPGKIDGENVRVIEQFLFNFISIVH